jgi:vitamin B12 transporter
MKSLLPGAAFTAANLVLCLDCLAAEPRDRQPEAVVVTATRVEQPLSEVIGSVSLITREDIERRAVQSTQDLLRGQTGLSVINTGGLGKLSNVFLRGADAEQVLVLIDGVRVGSASSGTTPFEFVPVDQIERIEIIRGPRSSLYGSDAIGGVIQIFTRRAHSPSVSVGVGSHETSNASASFGAASEHAWISLSGNRIQTEGYNSCAGAPFPPGGGCFTDEPDRDGYDNTSGSLRAGYKWTRAEIETTALYAAGTTEYDGSFANETDFAERVLTARGRVSPMEGWDLTLQIGGSRDEQDNLFDDPMAADEPAVVSRFNTERQHGSLQSDLLLSGAQTLTLGIDYLDDRIESDTAFSARSRNNAGAFAQYQVALGEHALLASARYDDNEQFGGHETGNLGWKWALSNNVFVTAAWGSAFGAPTFNDLYFPGFSNPNLDPETSQSYELGFGWTDAAMSASLTAFESRVDDLIVYDASIFAPDNLNQARIRGLEADFKATRGAWVFSLGYAALDPRNRTGGADYDNVLPRRARHSGHLEIGRTFGRLDGRVRFTAEGSRYDDVANTNRLGSYGIVDVVAEYALTPSWTLQGKIGNALDRNYRTVRLYNQDDRTFFVNMRYQAQ